MLGTSLSSRSVELLVASEVANVPSGIPGPAVEINIVELRKLAGLIVFASNP